MVIETETDTTIVGLVWAALGAAETVVAHPKETLGTLQLVELVLLQYPQLRSLVAPPFQVLMFKLSLTELWVSTFSPMFS